MPNDEAEALARQIAMYADIGTAEQMSEIVAFIRGYGEARYRAGAEALAEEFKQLLAAWARKA